MTMEEQMKPVVKEDGHDVYTVLIVDDDETFRSAHARSIDLLHLSRVNASFHALSAGSAEETMAMLAGNDVDCVLLDYRMPDIDGLELQQMILREYPDMAVVIVTGQGDEHIAANAIKLGAMDYMVKGTITLEQMELAIVNSVGKIRMTRSLEMQQKKLLDAERQRVMMQSLATACHHIAQPLTVLRNYIVLLKRKESDPETQSMLVESFKAVEAMCDILWRFKHVASYRTEPYLKDHPLDGDGSNDDIIQI